MPIGVLDPAEILSRWRAYAFASLGATGAPRVSAPARRMGRDAVPATGVSHQRRGRRTVRRRSSRACRWRGLACHRSTWCRCSSYVPSALASAIAASTTFFSAVLPSFMPTPYCSPVSNWAATLTLPGVVLDELVPHREVLDRGVDLAGQQGLGLRREVLVLDDLVAVRCGFLGFR